VPRVSTILIGDQIRIPGWVAHLVQQTSEFGFAEYILEVR
jgi:hypothetical protein